MKFGRLYPTGVVMNDSKEEITLIVGEVPARAPAFTLLAPEPAPALIVSTTLPLPTSNWKLVGYVNVPFTKSPAGEVVAGLLMVLNVGAARVLPVAEIVPL